MFGDLLKASRIERQHASRLRRLLVENNIDYDKLKTAYDGEAKDGLQKLIKDEVNYLFNLHLMYSSTESIIVFFTGSDCQ